MPSSVYIQYCKDLRLCNKMINLRKPEMAPFFFSSPLEILLNPDFHGEILSHVNQCLCTLWPAFVSILVVTKTLLTHFHSTGRLGLSIANYIYDFVGNEAELKKQNKNNNKSTWLRFLIDIIKQHAWVTLKTEWMFIEGTMEMDPEAGRLSLLCYQRRRHSSWRQFKTKSWRSLCLSLGLAPTLCVTHWKLNN